MSDEPMLDAAIRKAMDGEECEIEVVSIAPMVHSDAPEEAVICATHGCDWRDDEAIPCDEHRKIAAAVRIGWVAAIDAAIAYDLGRRDGITEAADKIVSDGPEADYGRRYDGNEDPLASAYSEGWRDAYDAVRALASTLTNEGADDAR